MFVFRIQCVVLTLYDSKYVGLTNISVDFQEEINYMKQRPPTEADSRSYKQGITCLLCNEKDHYGI